VVAASVIAMGLISLPIMMRYGYNRSFAAGTIAASGTLAQIVPPSLVLIVMADQLGRSVGDMYLGAFLPALLIIASYLFYVFLVSMIKPDWAPALPLEVRTLGSGIGSLIAIMALAVAIFFGTKATVFAHYTADIANVWASTVATIVCYGLALANRMFKLGILSRLTEEVVIVLVPPLALIFLVLGTIFLGIATPTEGGAMGAAGGLLMAFAKRRMNMASLKAALDSTAKLSAFVMFILIGARVFGLTFYGINGNTWMEELLLAIPGGQTGFLLVVTLIIFILGCFLDFFEIAFILVPLLAPVADKLGIDLIWFGIILGINLQTSFLTPPFGFALFYLRSIAPNRPWLDKATGKTMPPVKTTDIYKGVFPYIIIQVIMILVVIAFPGLVTHYKDEAPKPATTTIEVPASGDLGLPPLGLDNGANSNPLGLPPLEMPGSTAPDTTPATPSTNGTVNQNGMELPALGLPPAAPAPNP
jgi:TRAP-type mannitol/chloroaromatic compound transport system permease large subunit